MLEGNYIGTDATCTVNYWAGQWDVNVVGANTIGGPTASPGTGAGNLIVGAGTYGIYLEGGDGSTVEGNLIGLNAAGTAIPNNIGIYAVSTSTGLMIGGTTSNARNIISGNVTDGIQINFVVGQFAQPNGASILGNFIGTNLTGTARVPNGGQGIDLLSATNTTIGGLTTTPGTGAGNVVSGNSGFGIEVSGTGSNLIEGNLIGTTADGLSALGNAFDGVLILNAAGGNVVGGTVAGAGNVISGNLTGYGVNINKSSNELVSGNIIGLDLNCTNVLANAFDGVIVQSGGLASPASNNIIGGTTAAARNIISGNARYGVDLFGAGVSGTLVEGNYIGTDGSGSVARGNTLDGVYIDAGAFNNTIGGTTAAARNLISGATANGILITGNGATGNVVEGNYIGTNAAGTSAIGNSLDGVFITAGASGNTIGGTSAGTGDLISGNVVDGVEIFGAGTTGNVVEGDMIGTDFTGALALANHQDGVEIDASASGNTVGGTAAGARNLISGNMYCGVEITGSGTAGNFVEGDYVGVNAAGTSVLGNTAYGVEVHAGASGNIVGGTTAGSRNVISGNADGVVVDHGATLTLVEGNYIGTNAAGTGAIPNNDEGVSVFLAQNNTIGGAAAGAGNVISGNTFYGVVVQGNSDETTVAGNYIGTNASGTAAVPNGFEGVVVGDATNTTVGGTASGAGNVISGNTFGGIIIGESGEPSTTANTTIQGNFIGLNALGTAALGNANFGIETSQESNTTIGGSVAGAGNVISGTTTIGGFPNIPAATNGAGLIIGWDSLGTVIEGNKVGTDPTGSIAFPNAASGVAVWLNSASVSGNLISCNTGAGIFIYGDAVAAGFAGLWNADNNATDGYFSPDGTLTAGAGYAPGLAGQAFSFDGVSGAFIDSPKANRIKYTNVVNGGSSLSGWVKTTDADGTLISDGGGLDTASGTGLFVQGGKLVLKGSKGTAGQFNFVLNGPTINDGQWHQFASTWTDDTTVNGVKLYMDGVLVAQGTALSSISSGTTNLEFGGDPNLHALPYLNGLMDEVSAYNGVLAPSDIAAIFTQKAEAQTGQAATVSGNLIGTNPTGTVALANGGGVMVSSSVGATIGGTTAGTGNLISGNIGIGVTITGPESTGVLVEGNDIGTNAAGTSALGNTGDGVNISNGSHDVQIGSALPGARNVISGNAGVGVHISQTGIGAAVVAGNDIGTDATGRHAVGNQMGGVRIEASAPGIVIGGTSTLARNVISGNAGAGITLLSTGNFVEGNYVGIDSTGTQPLGNSGAGLTIAGASGTNQIGGTASGAGNVFSGNATGIAFTGAAGGDTIQGNFIGTDRTGTASVGNTGAGISIDHTPNVMVGGNVAGARNIISGNLAAGVSVTGPTGGGGFASGSTGVKIVGNFIGTDASGASPLGNLGPGVYVDAPSVAVGGTAGASGNAIAFDNTGVVVGVDASGVTILRNAIFSNQGPTGHGIGIDLGGNGVTLNDSQGHTGPNHYQNFPVLTNLTSPVGVGTTTITGSIQASPNTTYTIEFFSLSSINPSGYGEGRTFIGSIPVTTDATGEASFAPGFETSTRVKYVTATATDPAGNTSEFSQEFGHNNPPVAVIGFTARTVNEGTAVFFNGSGSTDPDGDPLTYAWDFGDGVTDTGVGPVHKYLDNGTYTVKLTVDDGFGGVTSTTATVVVRNVAPVFVPGTYLPPILFATPNAGDGYGAAVASVDGDVAVAARFEAVGPTHIPAGAVYLYDGVTDDDGIAVPRTYRQLIHTFTDPNPAAGDFFGASIASVGNVLLVGAPGASPTGAGDGAAYLFDADPDSPTFGALLATFVVPDADALHGAAFGSSVAAAGLDAVIGAPGKGGNVGEVYEFVGDTNSPAFGSLVLTVNDPTSQAGARFGAAVAGMGSNLVIGAPGDNTAGAGAGAAYVVNGTTGAFGAGVFNPHPSYPGFASAVASVGTNVLVGAPNDGTAGPGAGAAFLFNGGTGALITSFTQTGGGGGAFGTTVAGSVNSAFIGAPGARLGTANAGAAYLFDADPTDPTFGLPIGALQATLPASGDAFGTSVAFFDGALIVGAPGSQTFDLYQPGVPLSLSASTTYAVQAGSNSVILSGTFADPGVLDTHTASIDWGDGTPPSVVTLPAGAYAFSVPHRYSSVAQTRYGVTVTLTDKDGGVATAGTTVNLNDPAPIVMVTPSSPNVNENDTLTLNGTIVSPGGLHTNTVVIDWGDGSTESTVVLAPGVTSFAPTHVYLNNPAGQPVGTSNIRVWATDEDGKLGTASTSVMVHNVAPKFNASDIGLSATTINENQVVTLNGVFTDPGTLDLHTVTINWGDGSPSLILYQQLGQIVKGAAPGAFSYTATHTYVNNPVGIPVNGVFQVAVSVSDDVATTAATRGIVVNNVAPTVRIESQGNVGPNTIALTAHATDPGPLDTIQFAWTATNDGVPIVGTASGPNFSFQTPNHIGVLVVTATATDNDGGSGSGSAQIFVVSTDAASVTVAANQITVTVGATTTTIPSANAGAVIGLVYGSHDTVDAHTVNTPVEFDGYGSNENFTGGNGDDILVAAPNALIGLANVNVLTGGPGNDSLVSNRGCDSLFGGLGNDWFTINPGPDPLVNDASGQNTLDFTPADQGITIDLATATGQVQDVDARNDVVVLQGVFNVYVGSSKGDNVTGNANNDIIYGGSGNNTITGGSGNNSLVGGVGNDVIYGGTGNTTITERRRRRLAGRRRQRQRCHLRRLGKLHHHGRRRQRHDRRRHRQRRHLRRHDVRHGHRRHLGKYLDRRRAPRQRRHLRRQRPEHDLQRIGK